MKIHLLKLSNNKGEKDLLSSQDILSIYLGYFHMNGKVTYSTNVAIADNPNYVILILGNYPIYCWCHVAKCEYQNDIMFTPKDTDFEQYAPDKYKKNESKSWLLLDFMQIIPKDFLHKSQYSKEVVEFMGDRANYKKIDI